MVEFADVGCPPDVGSSHVEVPLGLVRDLDASPVQEHPTVDQVEHQHQQLDTAEGGHPVEQEGVAD